LLLYLHRIAAKELQQMSQPTFTAADLNKGFVVAIAIEAKDGQAEAVAEGLRLMIAPTMAEPGVKLFLPYRSPTNSHAFFIYELYETEAGWAAHQKTPHFENFVATIVPLTAKRERLPYIPF
jgi:quinol monooxygenase YgiN